MSSERCLNRQKTAERLACHILKLPGEEAMQLAYAIRDVKSLLKLVRFVLMFQRATRVISAVIFTGINPLFA